MKTYIVQGIEKTYLVKIKVQADSKLSAIEEYKKLLDWGHVDKLLYTTKIDCTATEDRTEKR